MSKKDKFVKLFKERTGGKHPNDFKANPKALSEILTADEELGQLFKAAVEEAATPESQIEAGMSGLFP